MENLRNAYEVKDAPRLTAGAWHGNPAAVDQPLNALHCCCVAAGAGGIGEERAGGRRAQVRAYSVSWSIQTIIERRCLHNTRLVDARSANDAVQRLRTARQGLVDACDVVEHELVSRGSQGWVGYGVVRWFLRFLASTCQHIRSTCRHAGIFAAHIVHSHDQSSRDAMTPQPQPSAANGRTSMPQGPYLQQPLLQQHVAAPPNHRPPPSSSKAPRRPQPQMQRAAKAGLQTPKRQGPRQGEGQRRTLRRSGSGCCSE